MHRLVKSSIALAIVLAAVGLNSVHQQSLIDRGVADALQAQPASQALAMPTGEVGAGNLADADGVLSDRMGEAGGVVLLSGQSAPGAVRLTWHLSGLSALNGVRLARSTQPLPAINMDESVEAPPGSASFLWTTPAGQWHFRLCLPASADPTGKCFAYSNDVKIEVLAAAGGKLTAPALPPPSQKTLADWAASRGPMYLETSVHPQGILLSWTTAASDGAGFDRYYVVRSETNPQLTWPDDGYITSIGDIGFNKYIDQEAVAGVTYYYRVCELGKNKSVACGAPAVGKK